MEILGVNSTAHGSGNGGSKKKSVLARLRRKLSPRIKSDSDSDSECSSESQFQMVFDFIDENGDGKISADELQRCVTVAGGQLSMEEAEAAVKSLDSDGDGMLGFNEFQKLMEGGGSSSTVEEERNMELMEAFGMYVMDDGSDCITPASLRKMLRRLGESKSIDDCKAMIRAFDLNGDGVLSFDEFAIMMR